MGDIIICRNDHNLKKNNTNWYMLLSTGVIYAHTLCPEYVLFDQFLHKNKVDQFIDCSNMLRPQLLLIKTDHLHCFDIVFSKSIKHKSGFELPKINLEQPNLTSFCGCISSQSLIAELNTSLTHPMPITSKAWDKCN